MLNVSYPRDRVWDTSSRDCDTKFLHYEFQASKGDTIVVALDKRANVRVLDSANFQRYRRGERHRYLGGQARLRQVRIPLPHASRWHVAIDLGGSTGRVKADVSVDQTPLRAT